MDPTHEHPHDERRRWLPELRLAVIATIVVLASSCTSTGAAKEPSPEEPAMQETVTKTDKEWKAILSPEVYKVTRQKGTEPPFSGKYYTFDGEGTYVCSNCGAPLFASDTKYASGSGWPSYYDAIAEGAIVETVDTSHGMIRTEIQCAACGAHLGHVFEDGPEPTGLRYCVNSLSLDFVPEGESGPALVPAEQ